MDEEVVVLQGQSGCTNLNALNGILTKEHDSDGDKVDLTPKVRKPYTITKQRERWTAEEHNKFLEAVQLHGRAWRRIEEHVGTKTAVQIRSHAQKFVSKMDRDANDNGTGNMKPIEIPPPRPKKKPAHPYPRKQVLFSTKEIPILGMLERSSSSVLSVSEQDRSPTSVVSVVESEFIDPFSNIPIGFASPVGLAPVSNNHESEILSPKNSVEGVDKHLSLGLTPAGLTTEDEPTMELDMNSSMEHIHSKEASSGESVVPTLKLFGKTLVLTNYCKLFSSRAADADQRSTQDMISESNCNSAMELYSEKLAEKVINGGFAMNGTWPGAGFLPAYYWWPPLYGNEANSTGETRAIPPPWLPCYANISFPYAHAQQQIRSIEGLNRSKQNECSGTGSNTDFEGANAAESEPDECRDEKEMGFFVVRKARKIDNGRAVKCSKGFVPYRRCDLEEKVTHPNIASDSVGDSQTLKLCL